MPPPGPEDAPQLVDLAQRASILRGSGLGVSCPDWALSRREIPKQLAQLPHYMCRNC